jgi:hypothetical protein
MNLQEQTNRIKQMMGLNTVNSILFESKRTEEDSINFLNKNNINNSEDIVKIFASKDKSNNQKNLPIMSYLYLITNKDSNTVDTQQISDIVNQYDELYVKNRIKPIQITKNGLVIGDKIFNDFLKFSEYIDAFSNSYSNNQSTSNTDSSSQSTTKPVKKPMWSGNDIDIYNGNNVGKCIEYTQGGLTNKSYGFCIGQPGNHMYKSYRDQKVSSFYFIVDRNRKNEDNSINLDDPLHIVVFDNTNKGIELTDANNSTGNISEYGQDVNGYINYLKSKGVPVEILVNRPKTEQETYEDNLLSTQNKDLSWFINLDNPKNPNYKKPVLEDGQTELNYYKSAYIGRGYLLSDEQFDFLLDSKNEDLISQYVNTGRQLSEEQIKKLSKQDKKSYFRIRTRGRIDAYEFNLMEKDDKESFINNNNNFITGKKDNFETVLSSLYETVNTIDEYNQITFNLLSLDSFIQKMKIIFKSNPYMFQGIISHLMKNNTEPEKVKNILGDIWNNYFNSGVSYGGDIESFIMGSPVPDKIVKLFGKIAEDSIRNLDVEGVRRLIPHDPNNRKAMINMLLSYGISQKIINEALTYLNDRYDLNYELLSDEDSNNLQESIGRIQEMIRILTES